MHELLHTNLNFFWTGILAETLQRRGLRRAVISPGSRSAPLTTAFALTRGIETTPVLDERSAAYYALGMVRATGHPVALVCTSGTAAANFLPAVVEARYAGLPLIVLTADRPPELRDCAAGQAIDQQKLYGDFVVWQHELALPDASLFPYLRNRTWQAWRQSWHKHGPVQMNVPFREPLAPTSDGYDWSLPEGFWERPEPLPMPLTEHEGILKDLRAAGEGIIVAGPSASAEPDAYARGVQELVRCLGWPILADTLSPLRHRCTGTTTTVAHYDAILRNSDLAESLRPEAVLQIGALPTSKVLRKWLGNLQVPTWIASERVDSLDPLHRSTAFWHASFEGLTPLGAYADEMPALTIAWGKAENDMQVQLEYRLEARNDFFEGRLPWVLAEALPAGTPVFLASSMPVRDAEFFWPHNRRACRVASNRGANGIDGTLSTALGFVEACGRPGVLITGDLAFLHDSNGLLLAEDYSGSLTVFLINNEGGGIFEKLSMAQFDPPFEKYFATPQAVDFAKLAEAHRIPHLMPNSWAEIAEIATQLPERGLRIVEIKTDRKADLSTRAKILG